MGISPDSFFSLNICRLAKIRRGIFANKNSQYCACHGKEADHKSIRQKPRYQRTTLPTGERIWACTFPRSFFPPENDCVERFVVGYLLYTHISSAYSYFSSYSLRYILYRRPFLRSEIFFIVLVKKQEEERKRNGKNDVYYHLTANIYPPLIVRYFVYLNLS